jgi:hypothetical protein
MHQQLWGYKVQEKIYLGAWKQKRLNITALSHYHSTLPRLHIHKHNSRFTNPLFEQSQTEYKIGQSDKIIYLYNTSLSQ